MFVLITLICDSYNLEEISSGNKFHLLLCNILGDGEPHETLETDVWKNFYGFADSSAFTS